MTDTTPAVSSTSASLATATDPLVTAALGLGWQLADLLETGAVRNGEQPERTSDLPSKSDLQPWQRTRIDLDAVGALIRQLTPRLRAAGVAIPKIEDAQTYADGQSTDDFQGAIRELHESLLQSLHGAEERLGRAYDLGRSLAYMVIKPTSDGFADSGELNNSEMPAQHQFRVHHVAKVQARLADLASVLPSNSARAVAISLQIWEDAILHPPSAPPAPRTRVIDRLPWPTRKAQQPNGAEPQTTEPEPAPVDFLMRQGKLWHALLTNQKQGVDMLDVNAYVQAAERLVTTTGALVVSVLKKRWAVIAAGVAVVVAVALGLVLFTDTSTGQRLTALLITAAGALGVTGASLKSTMTNAISSVERSLMAAEIDTAIAEAITVLPSDMRATSTPNAVAALNHRNVQPRGPDEGDDASQPDVSGLAASH